MSLKYCPTFRKGLFVPLNPAFAFTAAHLIKHSGLAKERVTDVWSISAGYKTLNDTCIKDIS